MEALVALIVATVCGPGDDSGAGVGLALAKRA